MHYYETPKFKRDLGGVIESAFGGNDCVGVAVDPLFNCTDHFALLFMKESDLFKQPYHVVVVECNFPSVYAQEDDTYARNVMGKQVQHSHKPMFSLEEITLNLPFKEACDKFFSYVNMPEQEPEVEPEFVPKKQHHKLLKYVLEQGKALNVQYDDGLITEVVGSFNISPFSEVLCSHFDFHLNSVEGAYVVVAKSLPITAESVICTVSVIDEGDDDTTIQDHTVCDFMTEFERWCLQTYGE